ncbi:hypothetical protein [Marivita sp.]|uniref:RraA family protein n=1 Tax=Marivita sp. TaxID=2003365 RepID=UPI0026042A8F|nr:hypothetical protein [Marivita sp.]
MPDIQIFPPVRRPDPEVVKALSRLSAAQAVDAMNRNGGMNGSIRAIWCEQPLVGTAITVQSAPHDVLAIYAALATSQPGDIIVAATNAYQGSAVLGSVMAGFMLNAGIVAFVTDGLVRDVDELDCARFPVFASGLSPNAPQKNGPGTVGGAIVVGGVAINCGDVIVADRDGVAVIPRDYAGNVVSKVPAILQREVEFASMHEQGHKAPDWLEDFMASERIINR